MKKLLILAAIIISNTVSYGFVAQVTNNADGGAGSLRQAIIDANPSDTILINVSGVITLNNKIDITGFDGLTIIGPYPAHLNIQPSVGMTGNLFDIQGSNNVTFHNIGFSNGNSNTVTRAARLETNIGPIKFKNCLFEGIINTSTDGGAIWLNNSELVVLNCSFFGNSATRGGAIHTESGVLKAVNCTFAANNASAEGGAIMMNSLYNGSFLNHCTFRENNAANGTAAYFAGDGSVIILKGNAVEGNGAGQQIVDAGGSAVNSEESNVIKDNGGEAYPWMQAFDELTAANLGFQLPHRTDGYGLKYYVPEDETSVVVDRPNVSLSVPEPIFDGRRAPRIITGNSSPLPDAGAVEYTPLRVTLNGGDNNVPGMLGWALLQANDPINYIEFDIPNGNLPAVINPNQTSLVDGFNSSVIIDGFSQETSVIPGPEATGNPGVLPGILPITVIDNQTLAYYIQLGPLAQNSRVSGLRFLGFESQAVDVNSADSVKIQGCVFGIDEFNVSNPNVNAGLRISGASNNVVGGKQHWQRNVFSGNGGGVDGCGLLLNAGTLNCIVVGNFFGTSSNGMSGITGPVNGGKGIVDRGASSKIGAPGILTRNIISGNLDMGIFEDGSNECTIQNNFIGLLHDGMTSLSNNLGVMADNGAGGLIIGGLQNDATRNYITANNDKNVLLRNCNNVQILGNVIGLDMGGVGTPMTSPFGVVIDGATSSYDIQIGSVANVNSRNIISGNLKAVQVLNSTGNVGIYNNYIGTDVAGTNGISAQDIGIEIESGASPVSIGFANGGNVISGFSSATSIGINIKAGSSGHFIQGNIIGLDESGNALIGNQKGIVVMGSGNFIGGDYVAGDGNVIAGNVDVGIEIGTGADGCFIRGNIIGTNEGGTAAIMPNQTIGIHITNASNTEIGGTGANVANLISGHSGTGGVGIQLDGTATNTQIFGNRIGTDLTGVSPIANLIGILVNDQHTAQIGSGLFGNENYICGNTNFGIDIHSNGNIMDGNIVGLGVGNSVAGMGNGVGLRINSASNSVGPTSTSVNIYSNNINEGIFINGDAADNNFIDNVYVGCDNSNNPFGNGTEGVQVVNGDNNMFGSSFPIYVAGNLGDGMLFTDNANFNEIVQSFVGDVFSTGATNSHGIIIDGNSSFNIVGADALFQGNIISANSNYGILIASDSNIVKGNYIGLDPGGTVLPNSAGISISACNGNVIGKDWSGNGIGNVISGNSYQGINANSTNGNIIAGNIIGLNESGSTSIPNQTGVYIGSSNNNQIGGDNSLGLGNTLSGNAEFGIVVEGGGAHDILGNTIGLNISGTAAIGNFWAGILLNGSSNCTIGESGNTNKRNVISGNNDAGIRIIAGSGHNIAQNLIGTDVSGISGVGIQDTGVSVINANAITIGGAYGSERNVIAGNAFAGVSIDNSTAVAVKGNTIGNISTFTQQNGVILAGGSTANFIGEPNAVNFGNEFIQNLNAGIVINDGAFFNKIRSNYIGYFRNNSLPDTLQEVGILVESTAGTANRLGEDTPGAGNYIGHNHSGIIIDGINDQTVYNNWIGLDTTGTIAFANLYEGIVLENGAATNQIGNSGALQPNVISGNGNGILISGAGTSTNYIYSNNIGMNTAETAAVANGVGFVIENGASGNHMGADVLTGNKIGGNYIGGIISNPTTTLNNVKGNEIGVLFPNTYGVVLDDGANANQIGGSYNERNVISGNDSIGLGLINCDGNFIESNYIGLAPNGLDNMGNLIGIYGENSDGNFIGGQAAEKENVISGNGLYGIALDQGSDNNQLKNNYVGTDYTGNVATAATANDVGILLFASNNNIIGGDWNIDEGNVVAGNNSVGIYLDSSSTNQIVGNNIGLSKDNNTYLGNGDDGIFLDHESNGNTIGTTVNGEENVITGNGNAGVRVKNSSGNTISANFIGNDDIGGTGTVGNGSNGQLYGVVFDTLSTSNVANQLNIISGHVLSGVYFNGPGCEFNQVEGNYIGVDATGNGPYSNGVTNVYFNNGAQNNILGGANPNIIGGDSQYQIQLFGATTAYNQIINNNINIGLDGSTTFNSDRGVFSTNFAHSNNIGSGFPGEGNYLGGFNENAIHLERADTSQVFGNSIGIDVNSVASPNVGAGIFLEGSDHCNIGGALVGSDSSNVIANNDAGIVVTNFVLNSSYGNELFGNSIYNNTNQGIDINNDGAELPNDTSNFSLWNNGEIDHPLILTAWNCGGGNTTHVGFEFYSANTIAGYRVEFYTNSGPDGNGFPEGETYLGQWTFDPAYTVDTIDIDLGVTLSPGTVLTATVTGVSGNTSEFSQEFLVENVPANPALTIVDETCLGANNGEIQIAAMGAHYFSIDDVTYEYGLNGDTLALPAGTYSVYAQYLNGCVQNTSATINAGPPLPFSYTVVDDTCGLGFGSITIDTTTTNGGGGSNNYAYTFSNGSDYLTNIDTVSITAGTYNIGLEDLTLGCFSDIDPVVVNDITDVADESFTFDDFCPNDTPMPVITGDTGGTFDFNPAPGDGATIDNATGEIFNAVTGNSYTVEYTVGICNESSTQTVVAAAVDDPTFTYPNFCVGTVPTNSPVTPGGTWELVSGTGNMDPSTGIFNPAAGNYNVAYTTNGTCPDADTILVTVFNQPTAPEIIAADTVFCEGEAITDFTVNTPDAGYTYNWFLDVIDTTPDFSGTLFNPGVLTSGETFIYLSYDDTMSCKSLADSIQIVFADDSLIYAADDQEVCLGSQLTLEAFGGVSYQWSASTQIIGELDESSTLSNITIAENFIVEITDSNGCVVIDTIAVTLADPSVCNVDTYNAFSPDGDGTNDYWLIDGIEGFPENTVTIFNRWGDALASFVNYDNQTVVWDGTNKSGNLLPSGTYFYIVEVGGSQNQAGWIQIVK